MVRSPAEGPLTANRPQKTQTGLDRYVQQMEDRKRRELGRLVQVERQMHAGAGAAAPAPAAAAVPVPAAEPARYRPMHKCTAILYWPTQSDEEKCLVLVCHPRAEKYRANDYSPDGQGSFLVHGPGKAKLQCVLLGRSELNKVVRHNPPMDARDIRHVEFLPSDHDCPLSFCKMHSLSGTWPTQRGRRENASIPT